MLCTYQVYSGWVTTQLNTVPGPGRAYTGRRPIGERTREPPSTNSHVSLASLFSACYIYTYIATLRWIVARISRRAHACTRIDNQAEARKKPSMRVMRAFLSFLFQQTPKQRNPKGEICKEGQGSKKNVEILALVRFYMHVKWITSCGGVEKNLVLMNYYFTCCSK